MNLSDIRKIIQECFLKEYTHDLFLPNSEPLIQLSDGLNIYKNGNSFILKKDDVMICSVINFQPSDTRRGGSYYYSILPKEYKKKFKNVYSLDGLSTNKNFLRMGYAKLFLTNLFEYAKSKGGDLVVLGVFKNNTGAVDLYEKLGFKTYVNLDVSKYMCLEL